MLLCENNFREGKNKNTSCYTEVSSEQVLTREASFEQIDDTMNETLVVVEDIQDSDKYVIAIFN